MLKDGPGGEENNRKNKPKDFPFSDIACTNDGDL
jgi:hypothetical protein